MTSIWQTRGIIYASILRAFRRNRFASLALTALFLCGVLPSTVLAQEDTSWRITQFDSVITVEQTGVLQVTETISVRFDSPHHGIFRDIPIVYRDAVNARVKIDLALTSVLEDAAPAVYTSSLSGGEMDIRIGSPDQMLSGDHIYTISYRVNRALLFFEDHDELYWNVTGSDWSVPIEQTTALVQLPALAEPGSIHCYAQDVETTDQATTCGIAKKENTVAFAAQGPVTVAVGFAKGVVAEPTRTERFWFFVSDNWPGVIPLVVALGVIVLWWKRGRDPREGTIIPEYDPPEHMLAVYAGAFAQEYVTKQHIVAMLIQMAVLGHLVIESTKTQQGFLGRDHLEVKLIRKTNGAGLDVAHKVLFEALFPSGTEAVSLAQMQGMISAATLHRIRTEVISSFEDRGFYAKRSFALRTACFFLAGALWFVGLLLFANFGSFFEGSCLVSGAIVAAFGWLMPQRTLAGAALHRQIKGFKLFLHTAERYRSAWQEREGIFSAYLPYAIAFNDVKHWAQVFEGIEEKNPAWYHSNLSFFSATQFGDDVLGISQMLGVALAPQASAAGGGGHVGGGFGGGGGGAW